MKRTLNFGLILTFGLVILFGASCSKDKSKDSDTELAQQQGEAVPVNNIKASSPTYTGPGGSVWNHDVTLDYVDRSGVSFFSVVSSSLNSGLTPQLITLDQSVVIVLGPKPSVFLGEEQRESSDSFYRVHVTGNFTKVNGGWDIEFFHKTFSRLKSPSNSPEVENALSASHGIARIRY
ncbi:MAG: hypothetical protein IPK68_00310 [Bdellovibrionales bacterium]|nr:hypothetical protein [Bdellovibrionales bacterium]